MSIQFIRVPYTSAGSFEPGFRPRLVHHTTEGSSLPGYAGSAPHMTVDVKRRKVYRHIPLTQMAKALVGSAQAGIATNGAHAIQIEWIGFSDASFAKRVGRSDLAVANWTKSDWAYVASVCRWVERQTGVPRKDTCSYQDRAHPMSRGEWTAYSGHCGHQHVPGNSHWDPSGSWRKDLVIGRPGEPGDYPGWAIQAPDEGPEVRQIQKWLNQVGSPKQQIAVDGQFGKSTSQRVRTFQKNHDLDADSVVGAATWRALRSAAKKEK